MGLLMGLPQKQKPAGTCPAGHSAQRMQRERIRCLPAWPARDRC